MITRTPLLFNPYDPGMRADPYPFYRRLREREPVHRSPLGFFVLSAYADVVAVQRDPRFGLVSETMRAVVASDAVDAVPPLARRALLLADPRQHRRFRALLGRCFTPRAVESLRDRVGPVVARVLDTLPRRGPLELAQGFARALPIAIVGEVLDLPAEHGEQYLTVARAMGRFLGTALDLRTIQGLSGPLLACEEHVRRVIAERRRRPGDDLLSMLIEGEFEGECAGDDEVVAYVSLVLGASYETTSNLIGNSLLALARHPHQLALLRREPELLGNAVEELLRYEPPAQLHGHWSLEDVEVRGVPVPRGAKVILLLGAANRDPAQFPEPDRLDLRRADVRHTSFGLGAHHCLGAWFARMVAQVVIPAFLERYPAIGAVLEPPEWRQEQVAVRALERLVVDAGPA